MDLDRTTEAAGTGAQGAAARIAGGVLLLVLAGITALFLPFLVMASDNCSEGDGRLICSAGWQQVVGTVPHLAGLLAGGLALGAMASRNRAAVLGLAGVLVLAAAWLTDLVIVGA